MDTRTIEKAINDGRIIVDKITRAKSLDELDALSAEIEEYSDFVNEKFGVFNEIFTKREKFSDLAFYIHMAIKEKEDHIEYYSSHQNEISYGVLDFLEYLESKEWLNVKNAE